jgi:hypothetical protein
MTAARDDRLVLRLISKGSIDRGDTFRSQRSRWDGALQSVRVVEGMWAKHGTY